MKTPNNDKKLISALDVKRPPARSATVSSTRKVIRDSLPFLVNCGGLSKCCEFFFFPCKTPFSLFILNNSSCRSSGDLPQPRQRLSNQHKGQLLLRFGAILWRAFVRFTIVDRHNGLSFLPRPIK